MGVQIATVKDLEDMITPLMSELQALRKEIREAQQSDLPELLTTAQAAKLLHVTEATIRRRVEKGEIDSVRNGRRILIPREAV